MTQSDAPQTYDTVCFHILAYEFDTDDPNAFDKKIRRKLASSGLGAYAPERIAILRSVKNELQREIGQFDRSRYYLKSTDQYAAMADFDIARMVDEFSSMYPSIAKDDLRGIVNFAIYLYYLR